MALTNESHTPGVWKQQNKSHKTGRHRSKRQIDVQNKGRVDVKTSSKRHRKVVDKITRRNNAKQLRTLKRQEAINEKRSIGVGHKPPHLTLLIPLHGNVDIKNVSRLIKECGQSDGGVVSEAPLATAGFTLNVPRLKHRYQIIEPGTPWHKEVLTCAHVADTVVFLVDCCETEPIDEHGHSLLSAMLAQGIPSMVFCVQSPKDEVKVKKLPVARRKMIQKSLEHFSSDIKLLLVDNEQETFNLLRTVAEMKRRKIGLRWRRSYFLAEKTEYEDCNEEKDTCTFKISGHVRGFPLDVNRLVHLVGWGEFQIKQIDEVVEHCPWKAQRSTNDNDLSIDERVVTIRGQQYHPWDRTGEFIKSDPETQEDLVAEAEVDPMEGEQTWPTEEELEEADEREAAVRKRKFAKKVLKGTSDYQAAWILDSDEEWEEGSDEEENDDGIEMMEDFEPRVDVESQVGEDDDAEMSETEDSEQLKDENIEDDPEDVALFREERSHQMFPDEIDTPSDVPARIRFQKYRGLQSFRTSPWDPKENLPLDYARIFQFQSFDRTRKKMKSQHPDEARSLEPGTYVTIHLMNVPLSYVKHHPVTSPLVMFSLFPHEQKMSVLHFALKQSGEQTIKNKEEFVFQVGFRRFRSKVIFSQHTLGSKHKMERFFPRTGVVIATVYAPITFPPANVMMFKESEGLLHPVASGTLYSINPDRIITKRIVLSGHPYRINKRAATIRYMFFNKEDVAWFKPVELRTKWGRRGHIKEPLGTHGHMKCFFNAQLTSQDTVLMVLYKRVFPKWSYQPITPTSDEAPSQNDEEMIEEFFGD